MPPPVTTRVLLAQPEHASVVARMLVDFNEEFGAPTPDLAVLEGRFESLLARPDVIVLLARDQVEMVGFALLTLRPTPYYDECLAQLEELYVVPGRRDCGIGTLLMDRALRESIQRGAGEMQINVALPS